METPGTPKSSRTGDRQETAQQLLRNFLVPLLPQLDKAGVSIHLRRLAYYLSEGGAKDYLDELAGEIREVNAANGWNILAEGEWSDTYKIPGILALVHSEVSEALEAFRKDDKQNFLEEMADVVIRVLDCVGGLTDDFEKVVRGKVEKNRSRGFRHGGKKV